MLITDMTSVKGILTQTLMDKPNKYHIRIHRMYNPRPVSVSWEIEKNRRNEDIHLMMVLRGKGSYVIGDQTYPMEKGQIYLVSNGCPHSVTTSKEDPVHIFSMRFGVYDNQRDMEIVHFFDKPFGLMVKPLDSSDFAEKLETCFQYYLYNQPTSSFREDLLMKELLLMFVDLEKNNYSLETRIYDIRDRIIRHHGIKVTLGELALYTGLSEKQFTRIFLQTFGTTPHQFILRTRMNYAKYLLEETDLPIKAIGAILNYADAFTFSRQFKKSEGCAPSFYRQP